MIHFRLMLAVIAISMVSGCTTTESGSKSESTPTNKARTSAPADPAKVARSASKPLIADHLICVQTGKSASTNYVFGSSHWQLTQPLKPSSAVLDRVRESAVVVLEAKLPATTVRFRQIQRLRYAQISPPIPPRIDRQIVQVLKKRLGKKMRKQWRREMSAGAVMRLLAVYAGLPTRRGRAGLDQYIVAAAPDQGNRIIGLEHYAEQAGLADGVQDWPAIYDGYLALAKCDECRKNLQNNMRSLDQDLVAGDWTGMTQRLLARKDIAAQFARPIIFRRDQRLARRIVRTIRDDSRSHFFAIGAAHMDGVIQHLNDEPDLTLKPNCHRAQ